MSTFTRLTLVGAERRAEVVVPSDEGVAAMLPQLLELLGESPRLAPQAVALVRVTGDQVDLALDPASQGLLDGEVLRVVRAAAAPPPAEVADVTDAAAEELRARTDRWSPSSRRVLAAVVVGLATAATIVAVPLVEQPFAGAAGVGVLALVLAAIAAGLGRAGRRYAGLVLTAAVVGAGVPFAALLLATGDVPLAEAATAGSLLAWVALGAGAGIGRSDRGAAVGAVAGIVLTTLQLVLGALLPEVRADAVVAVVAVIACGLLPWWAMTASGLTGLDDAALDGTPPRRPAVRLALGDAYAGLTWSTVAVAVAAATSCAGLIASRDTGATVLAVLALVVLALRTRSLPLRPQVALLWAAVVVPLLVGVLGPWGDGEPVAAAGGALALAVVGAAVAGFDASGQQRARWRRIGDLAELLGVLAMLPTLLGVLGLYADLLGTF
ncbi:EsaB/YukD family protein [Cellulomonas fimi]|uniref:EsaB/YukD family protein n=1 Tax=Cellulomonas fimi TaxID=1708 RepID=UPI00234D72DD|nr:EsaB/YukD family protein [Cellulomonas fimi]MDC7121723.1 EsaB/YukD family protein [Cellulomonas fimi]